MSTPLVVVARPTVTNQHIAIIGAGYVGLATALHLLQSRCTVTLFDSSSLGTGASGIAAGLMHTFMGPAAKLVWRGEEAYNHSLRLFVAASEALGRPVFKKSGILRLALSEEQCKNFYQRSLDHETVVWHNAEQTVSLVPEITPAPSILITNGISVDGAAYLQGLWKMCERLGAQLEVRKIRTLQELSHFDHVIVAAGAYSHLLPELAHLPITPVKGQLLQLKWPADRPPLPCPINSHVYCVMAPDHQSCFVGATYERSFKHAEADWEVAKKNLLPRVAEVLPFLADAEVIGIRAGLRASMPGHLPFSKRLSSRLSVITGMGSKGLLYHAMFNPVGCPMLST